MSVSLNLTRGLAALLRDRGISTELFLREAGLSPDLFPATFSLARTAGWTAHILEQAANNRLIRPDVIYVGPPERDLPG